MRAERSIFGKDPESKAYYAVAFNMPELAKGVDPTIIRQEAQALNDDRARFAKTTHRRIAWADILTFPMLGAAGVIACTNSWKLGLIGAVGGVIAALVRARENRGDMQIVSNGGFRVESFYGSPRAYKKSPTEIDAELKAHGFLSDVIPPASAEAFKGVSAVGSPRLVSLAQERRIVADLGVVSSHGKRVLSVLTALQASELEAQKKPLFVVDVQTMHGATEWVSARGTSLRAGWIDENGSAREVRLDYAVRPFDANDASVHQGVPWFANGVYADGSTVSLVLDRDSRSDGVQVQRGENSVTYQQWSERAAATVS